MRLAVLFHRLGPYHHARLNAAARLGEVLGIEVSSVDDTYAWEKVDGASGFQKVTLFSHKERHSQSHSEVVRRVRDALTASGAGAVAVPGWFEKSALAALAWCQETDTPAVLMSDSQEIDEPRRPLREFVKSCIVRMFSGGFVGGTPHVGYLAKLGMPRERIFTGYDVVDNAHFACGADCARQRAGSIRVQLIVPERFFLASCRFVEKKNLNRVLRAYSQYRKGAGTCAWDLILLGDGPLRRAVERLRDELGLGEALQLPGFKQYDELPAYYGLASAFVHASTVEQWGLVVNEAMAAGLPVLVSNRCGCAPDLVEEGRNGFTFDPHDVEGLARLMVRMSDGSEDLESMGRASREIISRWTPETFAENLWKAAECTMSNPRPKASLLDRALLWALIHR